MKNLLLLSCALIFTLIACKSSAGNKNEIKTIFSPKSQSNVAGTANFIEKNGTVTMVVNLSGLTPGEHAIHIHEKSDCSATDGSSAGGHWNPTFKKHGKWGSAEHHKGDIGNFTADLNGNATIKFSTSEWCIGCQDPTKDILGKGLIVHKGTDDFTSQPAGNAGARVACSAIIK
ncbi:superoxide dismutase family protein [Flavobacterium psychrophilum]|uniref:Superoxide dismutase [Cu-Zn] n=1 Tax=Flavobacterium psychrophilum TaxID=96345 RepID=A0A7U2ND04_FLAPS|nr:superoxide dismutase family protein [Flavobacterium psychrophilum]ELM3642939.1 superoxide dismutase family protein [Flavobacterium psychrophilum]OUD27241.1 superoxide dismutase [Flavobacterium psychrophilum]QRE02713.1 superoxide dismutase family protein [Flavobacterium psychrophilum]